MTRKAQICIPVVFQYYLVIFTPVHKSQHFRVACHMTSNRPPGHYGFKSEVCHFVVSFHLLTINEILLVICFAACLSCTIFVSYIFSYTSEQFKQNLFRSVFNLTVLLFFLEYCIRVALHHLLLFLSKSIPIEITWHHCVDCESATKRKLLFSPVSCGGFYPFFSVDKL